MSRIEVVQLLDHVGVRTSYDHAGYCKYTVMTDQFCRKKLSW
jgi:hypothetical protein